MATEKELDELLEWVIANKEIQSEIDCGDFFQSSFHYVDAEELEKKINEIKSRRNKVTS